MKVALCYDHLTKFGGAERGLMTLHELFPEAPLYSAVVDNQQATWASEFRVRSSFMQKLPGAAKRHEWYPGIPVFAFESFDFSEFDVVISITSAEAKGIVTSPHTLHICYLLTPTRFLWSHYLDYFTRPLLRKLSLPLVSLLRVWDGFAAARPDRYIAISKTIQQRIGNSYRRKSTVFPPPVDVNKFKIPAFAKALAGKQNSIRSASSGQELKIKKESYFLIVSRLVAYKHIEIAIKACNDLQLPLKIVGIGAEFKSLKAIAGRTIEFMGEVTDEELVTLYQNCSAFIAPQEEDFGISMVEALSCGRPVIAYQSGAASELITPHITGELFYPQSPEALAKILRKFAASQYNNRLCRESAGRFSAMQFKRNFLNYIEKEWKQFRQTVS